MASRRTTKGVARARGRRKNAKGAAARGGGGPDRAFAAVAGVAAFLVAVALFPFDALGLLPPGNPLGRAGQALRDALVGALGLGAAAVPLGLLAAAAAFGRWGSPELRKRAWILTGGLLLLLPFTAYLAPPLPVEACAPASRRVAATGYLGARLLGMPLCGVVGWFGVMFLAGAGWVALSVAAFGFNPAGLAVAGIAASARGLSRGARSARSAAGSATSAAGSAFASLKERRRPAAGRRKERKTLPEHELAGEPEPWASEPAASESGGQGSPAPSAAPWTEAGPAEPPASGYLPPAEESVSNPDSFPEDEPAPGDHPLPAIDLLAPPEPKNRQDMEAELDRLGEVLVETLGTFNIQSEIGGRTTGPAVTQFEVVPAAGVKVSRIANLDADLALAMKATSVRIVAPIPGKGAVGVEIPNPRPEMVRLREILEAPAFARAGGVLPLALGKDLTGHPFVTDLGKMPHGLIAGATGSGKSVCLNTIITSLVYRNGPDRLRLLLIDPKMVELSAYADLPHLRHPVVTDPKDAAGVLKWAVLEMERRYALLSANGVRSLKEFNQRVENGVVLRRSEPAGPEGDPERWVYEEGPLPYVVVVLDELADLMMSVQAEVEKPLTQLAQKARAIGIHLLVATQRPSVNVITGLIKANFPCRIAFRVASKTDSRTILDQNGADSLLGHGDMLFLPPGQSEPVRMQGAFISTEETEALMGWYREQSDTLEAIKARVALAEDDILEAVRAAEGGDEEGEEGTIQGDWDDLFREAAHACIQQGAGSTSLLQRRLRIGYGRAARIVDQLHEAGVLGPPDGSKPREVLVGPAGLDEICPS